MAVEELKSYTIKQAADLLGLAYHTVWRMIQRGELKAYRVGKTWRIRESVLHEYVAGQERVSKKKSLEQLREKIHKMLPTLFEQYQVETLELFGSYVRGEQHPDSDLDVLVTFREKPDLLEFVGLELFLEDILGVKVDLVPKDALKPRIGQHILQEAVAV